MLVVSELGTNAVKHTASGTPAGMFVVTVEREDGRSRVSVQDMGSDGKPAIHSGTRRGMVRERPGAAAGGRDSEGVGCQQERAGLGGVGRDGLHRR